MRIPTMLAVHAVCFAMLSGYSSAGNADSAPQTVDKRVKTSQRPHECHSFTPASVLALLPAFRQFDSAFSCGAPRNPAFTTR